MTLVTSCRAGSPGKICEKGSGLTARRLDPGCQLPGRGLSDYAPAMTEASNNHSHPHHHGPGEPGEPLSDIALRVRALETVLTQKGYVDPAAIDAIIETYETKVGPRNGARVVARAWSDPAYLQRLRENATAAIAELGFSGRQGEHMVVVENSPAQHNLVVCTLCSCYPWSVLGLPPVWYKSAPFRSKAVIDPRGVLKDFGVSLPTDTAIRVWDSTAELRYLVIPERPAGTDNWSEDRLADLVTRDSMIGTGLALRPDQLDPTAIQGAR
jgi:nitrile hydratase